MACGVPKGSEQLFSCSSKALNNMRVCILCTAVQHTRWGAGRFDGDRFQKGRPRKYEYNGETASVFSSTKQKRWKHREDQLCCNKLTTPPHPPLTTTHTRAYASAHTAIYIFKTTQKKRDLFCVFPLGNLEFKIAFVTISKPR